MLHSEHTITIQAPADVVFSTVTDITKNPRWVSIVKNVRLVSEGPVGVGTKFVETNELLGQTADVEKVVTAYDPPHTYAVRSTSGPVPHSITVTFEQAGAATTVRLVLEAEEPSGMGLLASMVIGVVKSLIDGDLVRLKKMIEQK